MSGPYAPVGGGGGYHMNTLATSDYGPPSAAAALPPPRLRRRKTLKYRLDAVLHDWWIGEVLALLAAYSLCGL